jgi:aryl-alcohol dehydrogenase-like predicted oxidoreductase
LTERYIGSWLKKTGRRDKVVIATKAAGPNAGITWVRGGRARDFDAANLRAAVDASLQRLQIEHIDLYQLHWPSRNAPIFGNNSYNPQHERAVSPSKTRWPRWASWSRKARSARSASPTNPAGA